MIKIIRSTKTIVMICVFAIIITTVSLLLYGCNVALFESYVNDLKGDLIGVSFQCNFYDNNGQQFMQVHGNKINMESNIVSEPVYVDGSYGYNNTMSSVITVTIDGSQIESCGSTVLFIEDGLTMDVDFNLESIKNIESDSDGFTDNTIIASIINEYKNAFGKPTVVVIQSQLGDPICAFSGEDVYWEVCHDLPKTTKVMIDGKALYIHRANFQIIDKELLD